jgi:hypothetical protein
VASSGPPGSSFGYLNNLLRSYLGDVASLKETFELVVPILEEQDKQRLKEYREARLVLSKVRTSDGGPVSNIPEIINATRLVRGHERRLRRARILFQGNSIVSLVSRFDHFFGATVRFLLRIRPERLEKLSVPYIEVAKAASLEELRHQIVRNEVEDLLRKSHEEQFKYLESFIGSIDEPQLWSRFIEITERRNLHVHTGGRASRQYIDACSRLGIKQPDWLKEKSYLPVDLVYFNRACLTFSEMGFKTAQTIMRKFFPKNLDVADNSLLGIGLDFLQRGQFQLAEMVFNYGVNLQQKWTTNDGLRKTFIVNKALACKLLGKGKECTSTLDLMDWSSAHAKYLVAVWILRDQAEKAATTMKALLRSGELNERQIFEWPIFSGFRESEVCRLAFKEVFNRELGLLPRP